MTLYFLNIKIFVLLLGKQGKKDFFYLIWEQERHNKNLEKPWK